MMGDNWYGDNYDSNVVTTSKATSFSYNPITGEFSDEDTKTSMINDWQQDLIPKIQSVRDFSILNSIIPQLQSATDEDEATEPI